MIAPKGRCVFPRKIKAAYIFAKKSVARGHGFQGSGGAYCPHGLGPVWKQEVQEVTRTHLVCRLSGPWRERWLRTAGTGPICSRSQWSATLSSSSLVLFILTALHCIVQHVTQKVKYRLYGTNNPHQVHQVHQVHISVPYNTSCPAPASVRQIRRQRFPFCTARRPSVFLSVQHVQVAESHRPSAPLTSSISYPICIQSTRPESW
jgi:hypothetical protein